MTHQFIINKNTPFSVTAYIYQSTKIGFPGSNMVEQTDVCNTYAGLDMCSIFKKRPGGHHKIMISCWWIPSGLTSSACFPTAIGHVTMCMPEFTLCFCWLKISNMHWSLGFNKLLSSDLSGLSWFNTCKMLQKTNKPFRPLKLFMVDPFSPLRMGQIAGQWLDS